MHLELDNINRILLIRTDRFGEFILNIPAIRLIRKRFPLAYICLMVNPQVAELIKTDPDINEVMVYDPKERRGILESCRLISEIKKRKFDLAVILNPQKKFNIITFLAGIPIRLGYDRKWGFLLTHKIKDTKFLGEKHEAEYNLDLLRRIGIESNDCSLCMPINKEDEANVASLLKECGISDRDLLIAIHPWTSDSIKQWPLSNFRELAQRLSEESKAKVIIIGGKEEIVRSKVFVNLNEDIINITGKTTLRQLAAILKKSKLLISCDSGPVHLAAAVGTRVIAIFRSDIPAKSSRRWGPWGEGHTVIEKNNLYDISVDEISNLLHLRGGEGWKE